MARTLLAVFLTMLILGCRRPGGGGEPPDVPEPPIVEEDAGTPPPPPVDGGTTPPGPSVLDRRDNLPGVVIIIIGVGGGTGANGNLQVGDKPEVTFTLKRRDGTLLRLNEMSSGSIYVSGPTTGYQRVLAPQSDLLTASRTNGDGSYTYVFANPIPEAYLPPLNDTQAFVAGFGGERTGLPLEPGTYTVAVQAYKNYQIDERTYRDSGNAVGNFLLGDAAELVKREVVTEAACNQCHTDLRAHGGSRNEIGTCVLCHTGGAEDRNVASAAGGTPGVTIEFGVMIHKIHMGSHLPSVVGVGVQPNGALDYSAKPVPYKVVGYNNNVFDFSHISFPVMPSGYVAFLFDQTGKIYQGAGGNGPMPRDVGWSALTPEQKLKEDRMRTGVVACEKCHGDPDGAGPLPAPAQGTNFETVATRQACGSCHDDIDWHKPYTANGSTMPAQVNDNACTICHMASGGPLAVRDSHLHPYNNPSLNTGVNLSVVSLAPGSGPDGRHRAGDPFEVTFSLTDNAGAQLPVMLLTRLQAIVTGPTTNRQIVLPNTNPFDFAFRKAPAFTGNGTISAPVVAAGAIKQTVAVVFTSPTTFDVVGSATPPLTGQAIGAAAGANANVTYQGLSFSVTQGATPFAVNDRFFIDVEPSAPTYTFRVPLDLPFERVGASTGKADVFTVGNTPLLWGYVTVLERTAIAAAAPLGEASQELARSVVIDAAASPGLAVGDRVVIDNALPNEEYAQVGRLQTTDDITGAELGAKDRVWFTTPLRFGHSAGASLQEVTLTTKREGTDYALTSVDQGTLTTLDGRFTAGNPVVVSYRTWGRFGWKRAAGDTVQAVYPAPIADSDDIDASLGDWKGLPLVGGTYTVSMWANRDFTVTPGRLQAPTTAWNNWATDNTTYRMISKPAARDFLFAEATKLEQRKVISSGANCDACHSDLQAHGFGRRGLETCLACHAAPGVEDAPKYNFATWYIPETRGETMDFRRLAHRIHSGGALKKPYQVNGVFLGTPYIADFNEIAFPALVGGVAECTKCHGADNTAWQEPAPRSQPLSPVPVKSWIPACGSCHDSPAAEAHFMVQAPGGNEACAVCHGRGRDYAVDLMHKVR